MRLRIHPWLLFGLALALAGCSAPLPLPPPDPSTLEDPNAFQGNAAWGHLEALAAIGPREMATPGSAQAREYISGQLQALGLEVVEQSVPARHSSGDPLTLHNVAASVPGESTDLLLIVAPYDTRSFDGFENLGINDGGSGVAVNLELARLIAAKPLPYTTWFVFLEGEQEAPGDTEAGHAGIQGLVGLLRERAALEQVRLVLLVNRVCDPDLHIARDLGSHRVYREEFFRAAKRLGLEAAFDPHAGFEAPDEGQDQLIFVGLNRVVVLADTSFGGDEPPGPFADTANDDLDHCAAGSLDTVGQVMLEGLSSISRRLRRIDRFVESPIGTTEALRLEHIQESEAESQADPSEIEAAPDAEAPPEGGGSDAAPESQEAP
ncbi:MAG: M28 family peptidase [Deltaproteobacteria bacterium]|nr:M28 family peptidase [Deltaproteobacteria bacterium]